MDGTVPESVQAERPAIELDSALVQESDTWLAHAQALTISSAGEYERAIEYIATAKTFRERWKAWFKPHMDRIDEVRNGFIHSLKELVDPLDGVEAALRESCATFVRAEKQREAQENEKRRLEAAKDQETRRVNMAAALETEGQRTSRPQLVAQAHQIINAPAPAPAYMPAKSGVPKKSGAGNREKWKARVNDKMALVKFVATHPQYEHLLDANDGALNKLAESFKNRLLIDGVESYDEIIITVSAKRVLGTR